MREKTEQRIKGWINYRAMPEEGVKKMIHEETRYLEVDFSPWLPGTKKIGLATFLRMLLKHLNLEVVIIEESVELKKKPQKRKEKKKCQ